MYNGTPYLECYESFLGLINDRDILYPYEDETDEEFNTRLSDYLLMLFKKAIVKFNFSVTLLTRSDEEEMFENVLRQVEIEIIGMLMLKEYYRKQLNFLTSLKHSFSDKDWKSHDKSNQVHQYRQLINQISKEIRDLMIENSYIDESGRLVYFDNK